MADQRIWMKDLDPPADWAMESRREEGGWVIEARWWGVEGEPVTQGPRTVLVYSEPNANPATLRRGVTSGVMRRLEGLLGEMTAEVHEATPSVNAFDRMVRDYLRPRVAKLAGGPRVGGDAYYRHLLGLYGDLVERGHPEPMKALASAVGVPRETLKTQLRVARQRAERAGGSE